MNKKPSRLFTPNMLIYFIVMAVFALMGWFLLPPVPAVLETVAVILCLVYHQYRSAIQKKQITTYLSEVGFAVDAVSDKTLRIPLPAGILDLDTQEITWHNEELLAVSGTGDSLLGLSIQEVFPGMDTAWLREGLTAAPEPVTCGDRHYYVYGNLIKTSRTGGNATAMLYWADMTDLLNTQQEYNLSRPVVGIIFVDNYDELISNLPDRSISGLSAKLDDAIITWASVGGSILRKLERNRYLFLFEQRELQQFIDDRFSILDTIHSITNDFGVPASLTIGLGKDGNGFSENYEFATLSVEMSLSRGGDQAVIKDRYNFTFYGGRATETERRTTVRSRVLANSLKELILESSNVFVMGHKNADLDAVGAAAGIMAICRKLEHPAKMVVDLRHNSAMPLLKELTALPVYTGCFLSPTEAAAELDENSLLVIVDTNRPDQVESKELLARCSRVAVIDHHRRAADYIEDALLNFHEPYASSASELVTELVQYLMEREDLIPADTLSLLAGIVLDTKNFSVRTGARTFEAAAWLRKHGADTVAVKLLFQNDLDSTLARYEILRHAERYREDIALCCLDYTADRITAAQAADELLSISGFQASFVFYPDGDQVIVSARSIGEANVQMILEPLGGGGNQATAGAQIKNTTPENVKRAIQYSIDNFFSE